jgi:acyl-coenzyme A synthetase/AMP-(fatty) acid ligase
VTYQGRQDDMLKVAGQWVSPGEIESCLLTHPAVSECAVVGSRDAQGLLKPLAYVVARGPAPGTDLAEALQAHVRAHLAAHKTPRRVILVDSLPRTHLGKVDRGRLRAPGDPATPTPDAADPGARP